MRDLNNLKRLDKLRKEAQEINDSLNEENKKLEESLKDIIEKKCEEFIKELTEISKYGYAGGTCFKLNYYADEEIPQLIHVKNPHDKNGFILKANPRGYFSQVVIYDSSNNTWDWYAKESKEFIALHKDEILDIIEKKVASSILKEIENTKIINKNSELKNKIELLNE